MSPLLSSTTTARTRARTIEARRRRTPTYNADGRRA